MKTELYYIHLLCYCDSFLGDVVCLFSLALSTLSFFLFFAPVDSSTPYHVLKQHIAILALCEGTKDLVPENMGLSLDSILFSVKQR